MRITLEIRDEDADLVASLIANNDLATLLRDALAEFCAVRQNGANVPNLVDSNELIAERAQRYVDRRYSDQNVAFRARKVREVAQRVRLAAALYRSKKHPDHGCGHVELYSDSYANPD